MGSKVLLLPLTVYAILRQSDSSGCTSNSNCPPSMKCIKGLCVYNDACQYVSCPTNTQCVDVNNAAVCECLPGYVQTSTDCQLSTAKCTANSQCPKLAACVNGICTFANPCVVFECGPNSQCVVGAGMQASCACLPGYSPTFTGCEQTSVVGCIYNIDCPAPTFCVSGQCVYSDVCENVACSTNAQCVILKGQAECQCKPGYTKTIFGCLQQQQIGYNANPCEDADCGLNAECVIANGQPVCRCPPGYKQTNAGCVLQGGVVNVSGCQGIKCPPNSKCAVVQGLPACL